MSGQEDAPLTSRSSERPMSRAVLHHRLSAGVAQLYVGRQCEPMTTRKRILVILLLAVAVPVLWFRARHCRTVVVRDLSVASTQTVSVAFHPISLRWSISVHAEGTGTLYIPYVFSNIVSGSFSTNGAGDYYDTNVTVIYIPRGTTHGKIRASFLLHEFYWPGLYLH